MPGPRKDIGSAWNALEGLLQLHLLMKPTYRPGSEPPGEPDPRRHVNDAFYRLKFSGRIKCEQIRLMQYLVESILTVITREQCASSSRPSTT